MDSFLNSSLHSALLQTQATKMTHRDMDSQLPTEAQWWALEAWDQEDSAGPTNLQAVEATKSEKIFETESVCTKDVFLNVQSSLF